MKQDFRDMGIRHFGEIADQIDPCVTVLDVSDNNVNATDYLGELSELTVLYANDCRIKSVYGLDKIPKLKRLNLAGNRVSDFSWADQVSGLITLDVSRNRLESLDGIDSFRSLRNLDVSQNKISDISPLRENRNLEHLVLSRCEIEEIPDLGDMEKLKSLLLVANGIRDVGFLESFHDLEYLDLSGNAIGHSGLNQLLAMDLTNLNRLLIENCSLDLNSSELNSVFSEFRSRGVEVGNYTFNGVSFPYNMLGKLGEGGTFDVYLVFKSENSDERISKQRKINDFVHKYDRSLLFDQVMREFSVACDEDVFCLLVPKQERMVSRVSNVSGYRMLKEVGSSDLLERGYMVGHMLNGIKGVPKTFERSEVYLTYAPGNGEIDSRFKTKCLVQEFISGKSLDKVLGEDYSEKDVLGYVAQLLEVLSDVHNRDIVHCFFNYFKKIIRTFSLGQTQRFSIRN